MDGARMYKEMTDLTEKVKEFSRQLTDVNKRVKELEQVKTFFPMTESKHQALLTNCIDNDEAILHKREIEGVKS